MANTKHKSTKSMASIIKMEHWGEIFHKYELEWPCTPKKVDDFKVFIFSVACSRPWRFDVRVPIFDPGLLPTIKDGCRWSAWKASNEACQNVVHITKKRYLTNPRNDFEGSLKGSISFKHDGLTT